MSDISGKNRDLHQLLDNLVSLAIVRGLDYLVPLITLPYLVRILGIEGFGLVNYALSFALYFSAVMQYGFTITAVRKIAKNRDNPKEIAVIYSETITATMLLIVAGALIYFPMVLFINDFYQHFWLYVFSFTFIVAQALFPLWFFRGVERMRQSAVISITSKLLMLSGMFIFIKNESDYYLVPALNTAAMAGCAIFSAFWISSQYDISYKIPSLKKIKDVYKEGWDIFISQLAPNLYNNSAFFLLGVFAGPTAVGFFSAASKVVDIFNSAGMIISNAFFPYLARNKNMIPKFHKLMLLMGLLLMILCFVFSDFITAILFADKGAGIAYYIKLMSCGILAYFMTLSFHHNGLVLAGKDRYVRLISVWVSVFFFLIGLGIVPVFGIYGAMIMLVGARIMMAVCGLFFYKKYAADIF